MARTRKTTSIEDKIEKAQQKVISTNARYDAAVTELRTLYDKRNAMRKDELMNAFVKSDRTYEEVLAYLQAGTTDEEKPTRKRRGRKPKNEV